MRQVSGERQGKILPLALLCCWPTVGLAAGQVSPRAVALDIFPGAGSSWTLEHDPEAQQISARLGDGFEVALEIDYDGPERDDHLVGITPILGGRRLEGAFWGSTAPLIYPQLDPTGHQIERLAVRTEGGALKVGFAGGSYRILDPAGPDEALFMEAIFRRLGDRLVVDLYGLYYLLPSQGGTRLELIAAGEPASRTIEPGSDEGASRVRDGSSTMLEVRDEESRHLEYFDRVTKVEIDDRRFGRMRLDTWVDRLQIQVNREPGVDIELFELDFDHTFKDRGQRRVMSRLSIDLP